MPSETQDSIFSALMRGALGIESPRPPRTQQERNRAALDAGATVLDYGDSGRMHLHDGNPGITRTGWTRCGMAWREPSEVRHRKDVADADICGNCLRAKGFSE